ncbi:MAG: hypothetical protein J2P45_28550, partial [Candidatus Dormibacteraeota bacterium]|nr:hypothetical protein [Candidatus Dormibacteraeota bacterium]
KTPPIEPFVEAVAAMVGGSDWPEGDLRISAVDCQSGDLQLWTMASGVGLDRAVTSSIAVPAVIGPVPVAGRLYMDGGVDSPNHADLLVGSGVPKAVFIGPLAGPSTVPALDALLQRERQHLEEAGIPLFQVVPGPNYASIGMEAMNAGHAPAALEIGRADGRAAAPALEEFLSS